MTYAVLTKRVVKIAAGVFMDREEVERMRPISSHLDRTSFINKGFIIWPKDYTENFAFAETKRAIPGLSCSFG